ncbi:MAG TPA: hypothetical protein VK648_13690 [Gemmatimonadaceae bacterium]|nr:MAG: hypothetical protein DMD62_10305 [Gemmatimonadota bacterium]HTD84835.1 hypothetical protein [Gemmatimonadaceae bacterium]
MLSLLLITALAVQYPQSSKPATTDTTASRSAQAAPRGSSQSATSRQAFHDRMRELWSDHIVYTRSFIVSASAALPDTAEALQRLLRNQDEIGEAVKPYYGDAAGTQLASLLRNHIQLAGKTLMAAKGTSTAMNMQNQSSSQYSNTMRADTVSSKTDTSSRMNNSQYPSNPSSSSKMNDTTKARRSGINNDSTQAKTTATQSTAYAQGQQYNQQNQAGENQVDSVSLNQAIAALKANGDSIADFLAKANPRGFNQGTLRSALQMHLTLLLKEATAQIKKDWSGSIAAFDESQRQAQQMADMLSDGIMKQFPSRFNTKATAVSSR